MRLRFAHQRGEVTNVKTHYGETIVVKIRKLEKTMIKYSSYANYLRFSLLCHHNKILPKDLELKRRIKTERSKIMKSALMKVKSFNFIDKKDLRTHISNFVTQDGEGSNVGNPLSKDFLGKIEDGTLSAVGDYSAKQPIELNKMLSFWRNGRKRIM